MYERKDIVELLLDLGFDVNERVRLKELEEETWSWGMPLWFAAGSGKHEIAQLLLARGADPNGQVYASGTPLFQAYAAADAKMLALLMRHGATPDAPTAGLFRDVELAQRMLDGSVEVKHDRDAWAGQAIAEQLLWGAACGGSPAIVRMALARVDWPRDDRRWFHILEQPPHFWSYKSQRPADRNDYLECFRLVLARSDANLVGRYGRTMLHVIASARMAGSAEERVSFARELLDAGARVDVRDEILRSTPLGWACRWGRIELVRLFLDRGASRDESATEPWARPIAWARRMGHTRIVELLTS